MSATPVFHVQLTFGPMLIGVFLNMVLYGILLSQMHLYYQVSWKSDSSWIRLLVTYLFLVETANTALDMVMMYQPLIAEYGTQEAVAKFPTLFMTEPIVIVLISTPIQCFFAWRILKITRSYFIPVIIVALAFASSAGGFITGIKIAMLKLFTKKPELHWSALLWFLTSCVADLLITATLVMSLSKRKTGFDGTDSVIDKLTRTTVQTGMITAVCAIGDVVFFMALPRTALNFIWDLALSKLYTNCLMSTLNARTGLSSRGLGSTEPVQDRGQVVDSDLKFASDNLRSIAQIISEPKVQESDIGVISRSQTPSHQVVSYRGGDAEYGIIVTKVMEVREDPNSSAIMTMA